MTAAAFTAATIGKAVRATRMSARAPVALTLRGPWKNRDASWHLNKWGAPPEWDYGSLPSAIHHRDGGLHVFTLPEPAEVLRYARKAAKHPSAVPVLDLLAHVALFAHMDIRDAVWLQRWLLSKDPQAHSPSRLSEWREVGVLAVTVMQRRWHSAGVSDKLAAVAEVHRLRDDLNRLTLAAAERQFHDLRTAMGVAS